MTPVRTIPGREASGTDWRIPLECGHALKVPLGSPGALVMALVLRHRDVCPAESHNSIAAVAGGLPLAFPVGRASY